MEDFVLKYLDLPIFDFVLKYLDLPIDKEEYQKYASDVWSSPSYPISVF